MSESIDEIIDELADELLSYDFADMLATIRDEADARETLRELMQPKIGGDPINWADVAAVAVVGLLRDI